MGEYLVTSQVVCKALHWGEQEIFREAVNHHEVLRNTLEAEQNTFEQLQNHFGEMREIYTEEAEELEAEEDRTHPRVKPAVPPSS
jgi:hypothetical protein